MASFTEKWKLSIQEVKTRWFFPTSFLTTNFNFFHNGIPATKSCFTTNQNKFVILHYFLKHLPVNIFCCIKYLNTVPSWTQKTKWNICVEIPVTCVRTCPFINFPKQKSQFKKQCRKFGRFFDKLNCKRIDCDAVGSKYYIRGGCTHVEAKWPCFKESEAKRMMGKSFARNLLQSDDVVMDSLVVKDVLPFKKKTTV